MSKALFGSTLRNRYFLLAFAPVALFLVNPASADESYKLECTLDKYRPGQNYTEVELRGWIPDKLVVDRKGNQSIQIYFPSGNRRIEGEVFRENNKKFSVRFHQRSASKDNVTFSLDYFKESGKIFVTEQTQAAYAPMGDISGTCKSFPVTQRNRAGYGVSGQGTPGDAFSRAPDKLVCNMATEYGAWQQRRPLQKFVAEARDRGLTLEDCERVLKAN